MTTLKFKITFTEGLLGTSPNDEDVYRNFIASKAPGANSVEDEIASVGVDEVIEKGMTVFPRNPEGNPILWDYQIKGFFKDSCKMLSKLTEKTAASDSDTEAADGKKKKAGAKKVAKNESGKITAYKQVIDGLVFPEPRMIPIHINGEMGVCQRPLRAQTAQGERVALAMSEEIPAGSSVEFSVKLLDDKLAPAVREWMEYGALRGIGQWRNSGKGRFTYEELTD